MARKAKLVPREERLARRRAQSREEILEAARRVLAREGLAGTTLTAIAAEAGLTKAALYYYFPSRDAVLFECAFQIFEREVMSVRDAVETTKTGAQALRAIIEATFDGFTARPDDFRLAYLQPQVSEVGAFHASPEQTARIRPLNDIIYGGAERKVAAERRSTNSVEARKLAFLAHVSTLGLLTYKGLVESTGSSLRYSNAELLDDLARIFAAAVKG
jgi:AcrR family transcriptional regulator